jgi:hypothetical protein
MESQRKIAQRTRELILDIDGEDLLGVLWLKSEERSETRCYIVEKERCYVYENSRTWECEANAKCVLPVLNRPQEEEQQHLLFKTAHAMHLTLQTLAHIGITTDSSRPRWMLLSDYRYENTSCCDANPSCSRVVFGFEIFVDNFADESLALATYQRELSIGRGHSEEEEEENDPEFIWSQRCLQGADSEAS